MKVFAARLFRTSLIDCFIPAIQSMSRFTMLGFSVGGMRSKYRELAKKDGEKDCEDRYGLPNLYVEGNTKWAKAFNCTQRAHQQQLETLTQFYVCILLSALQFPVSASVI